MKKICLVSSSYLIDKSWIRQDFIILREIGYEVKLLSISERYPTFRFLLKAIRKFKEIRHCDLIYGWFAFTPTAILGKILNIPTLINAVGYEVAYYPEFKYGLLSWWFPRALLRISLKNTDFLIAISKETAKNVKRYVPEKDVYVIYEGIDPKKFKCISKNRIPNQISTVLYLSKGNIIRKNLTRVIYAIKNVKKFPDIKLVIIGKKLDGYPILEKLVSKLGLEDNVDFKGFICFNELLDILCSSKVFIMPSLQEGFPTAISEALLCETPVITSNKPTMNEVFIDNIHVILVDPYNVNEISDAIITMLNNEKLSRKLAQEGKKHILNNFSYEIRKRNIRKILFLINRKLNHLKKTPSLKWILIALTLALWSTLIVGPYKLYVNFINTIRKNKM